MPTPPFKVRAVFEYASPEADDLSFPNGQIITVTEEEDEGWYSGAYIDSLGKKLEGIFPKNFVEKYEPEIPSRPTRPARIKRDVEQLRSAEAISTRPGAFKESDVLLHGGEYERRDEPAAHALSPKNDHIAPNIQPQAPLHESTASTTTTSSPPTSVNTTPPKSQPPQVAEKPSGGSFRDRIAAFNKPAAPPIAPFKPGGQSGAGTTNFIKKPFVAPPPSKNAYVPPPRELPPQKIYHREEDPSLVAETAHDPETTLPHDIEHESMADDQPKPTSLKDRIALLQKQQLEQAARHAENVQKKEKPKKPIKRRTDPQVGGEVAEAPVEAEPQREQSGDTVRRKSVDFADDERGTFRSEKSRHTPASLATPPQPSRELMSDTNDADYSAAGDTEGLDDLSTEEEKPRIKHSGTDVQLQPEPRSELQSTRIEGVGGEENEHDEEEEEEEEEDEGEEDELDPEVRRRMEIRERMAKMSGGMGMMGMFGPTSGGMPMPGRKPKTSTESDKHSSNAYEEQANMARAPPIPVLALHGISRKRSPEPSEQPKANLEDELEVNDEQLESRPPPTEVDDRSSHPPQRTLTDRSSHNGKSWLEANLWCAARPDMKTQSEQYRLLFQKRHEQPPGQCRQTDLCHRRHPLHRPQVLLLTCDVLTMYIDHDPARTVPTPPSRNVMPLSAGEDSDDERSMGGSQWSLDKSLNSQQRPQSKDGPPRLPAAPPVPSTRPMGELASLDTVSAAVLTTNEKRISRGPPPVPSMSPTLTSPIQSRAPPPPLPGLPPSRRSTNDSRNVHTTPKHQVNDDSEEEVTEYDGDYDTDIASSVKHKDALKSHARDSSLDEATLTDEAASLKSPTSPPGRIPPPAQPITAPREVPPAPPQQLHRQSRRSTDIPRAAPPPVPPTKEAPTATESADDEYDPYRHPMSQYGAMSPVPKSPYAPLLASPQEETEEDELYKAPTINRIPPVPPIERSLPPPTTSTTTVALPSAPMRQSLEASLNSTQTRRSMEQNRPPGEHSFIATDIDLAHSSFWWTQDSTPPPPLRNRPDLFYEIESSTSSKRGGKTTVSKDVYVLYVDYSQTVITAIFDAAEPSNVTLEQRHERPPPPPRQDQLESASQQFGSRIAHAASLKQQAMIGDGTAPALILDILQALSSEVLLPVGIRSYGALVYANLANASTQQSDEIRPGDIITFRNAKFAGHKGTMHGKYAMDVGKPDHVGIVMDWDGTKKKIRAWEQGREVDGDGRGKPKRSKVREESFRMGDLRSGEIRVWRVMPRKWVGWESGQK